uniref:Uncharacterized protein n=1 Tax=Brassica campestris TaxID=3711 RepID=M4DMV8_BRACM
MGLMRSVFVKLQSPVLLLFDDNQVLCLDKPIRNSCLNSYKLPEEIGMVSPSCLVFILNMEVKKKWSVISLSSSLVFLSQSLRLKGDQKYSENLRSTIIDRVISGRLRSGVSQPLFVFIGDCL